MGPLIATDMATGTAIVKTSEITTITDQERVPHMATNMTFATLQRRTEIGSSHAQEEVRSVARSPC